MVNTAKVVGTFESSSSDKIYEVKEKDGKLSCNCPAWIFNHSGRTCKHTIEVSKTLVVKPSVQVASPKGMPSGWVHPLLKKVTIKKPVVQEKSKPVEVKPEPIMTKASTETVDFIEPMLAAKVDKLALLRLVHDSNWVVETKFDGSRYILYIQKTGGRLFSKHVSEKDGQYVEKTDNVPHITHQVYEGLDGTVLDTEVTVANVDFGGVISVMGSSSDLAQEKQRDGNVAKLNVFDCIRYKGEDISSQPLSKRREYAAKVVKEMNNPHVLLVEQRPASEAVKWFNEITEAGGEGVVLKNLNSAYLFGKRAKTGWVKMKKIQTYDVVVTGYTDPDQYSVDVNGVQTINTHWEKGLIACITFGVYKNGKLIEIGKTTGLKDSLRKDISENKEKYIGQVMEVEGAPILRGKPRFPQFKRFRPDANAVDCTWEKLFIS